MENKNTEVGFSYTYSAKEQEEIKKIREKYQPREEDDISRLRKLDARVTRRATNISLTIGIIGALIMGSGMSLVMTDIGGVFGIQGIAAIVVGIIIGLAGIIMAGIAYPIYCKVLKKEREKAAPEILRLTEALIKDLLSATLVACANDAVAALASFFGQTYLGGDINTFVERMNKKAVTLGLENTNFANPTGLEDPDQYTTPREVVLLTTAFYRYNDLVNLSNVESFVFNLKSTVRNKNYLKSNYFVNGFLNKNAIGLIAGQLDRSGNYSLITASQNEGRTYIFAVMCASGMIVEKEEDKITYSFGEGNAYADMNKLIDWVRNSFKYLTVATTDKIVGELRVNLGSSADHVMVVPAENVEKLVLDIPDAIPEATLVYDETSVYKKEFNGKDYDTIDAPVSAGQKVGTIIYSYNGREIARVDAVAREGIESDGVKATLDNAKNFLFGGVMKTVLYVIVGLVAAWILFSVIMAIVRSVKRVKGKNGKNTEKEPKKRKKEKAAKAKKNENDLNATTREMR